VARNRSSWPGRDTSARAFRKRPFLSIGQPLPLLDLTVFLARGLPVAGTLRKISCGPGRSRGCWARCSRSKIWKEQESSRFLREDPAVAVVQQRVQCSTTQCNAMQCSSRIAAPESILGVFFGGQRHLGRPISPRDRQKEGSTTQGSAVSMELLLRKVWGLP